MAGYGSTHDLEMERELLGCSFIALDLAGMVADTAEDLYYTQAHRDIHHAIKRIVAQGGVPTPGLVVDELRPEVQERDACTAAVLACLDAIAVAVPATVSHLIARLQDHATRRWLQRLCMQCIDDLSGQTPPRDLITRMTQDLLAHREMRSTCTLRSIGDVVAEVYDTLDRPQDGVTWGFSRMDAIYGMNGQDWLTFIGGRPSSGKTALALNMAYNVAASGRPTLFASLEMSDAQAGTRVLSGVARVSAKNIRERMFDGLNRPVDEVVGQIARACGEMRDVPMYISAPRASIADLRRDVLRVQQATGQRLGGLYIDRLELLGEIKESKGDSQHIATMRAAVALQDLSKELQIPILCLVQLSREIERRGGGMPRMSDARESGSVEECAMVMMLFEHQQHEPGWVQYRRLHVVKNMHGQTGAIDMAFVPDSTYFRDVTDAELQSLRAARQQG